LLLRQSNPRAGVSQIEVALKQSGVPVARNGIAVPRIDLGAALPLVAPGT
jgi:hypothetical protein